VAAPAGPHEAGDTSPAPPVLTLYTGGANGTAEPAIPVVRRPPERDRAVICKKRSNFAARNPNAIKAIAIGTEARDVRPFAARSDKLRIIGCRHPRGGFLAVSMP